MILRWFASAVVDLFFSAIAIFLSPLWALPFFVTTKKSKWSLVPEGRETLIGPLQLLSTWDDGIDAGWFESKYDDRMTSWWTNPQKARDGNGFAKYCLRMAWLIRNSAYGVAHFFLGFDRTGGYTTEIIKKVGVWDSHETNYEVRVDTKTNGQKAFLVRGQIIIRDNWYLRIQLGWKLTWVEDNVQVATHINPFRTWDY